MHSSQLSELAAKVVRIALCAVCLATTTAYPASVFSGRLHGRNAFILENGLVRMSVLRGGGFIGEVRFLSRDLRLALNPMRVPHYPTIDPFDYDAKVHGGVYGTDTQKRLMAAYMGHFLCFPNYGPPSSDEEVRAGFNNHGEAILVEWKQLDSRPIPGGVTLRLGAELPLNQYQVEREFTLLDGESVFYVEESVTNLATFDRPVNWVQHVTFGPPFVEPGKHYIDAPVAGVDMQVDSPVTARWPVATIRGESVDLRQFEPRPKSGRYHALLLDRSRRSAYFTAYNSGYPVLIGHIFLAKDNPWIGDWQENQRVTRIPLDGKVVARGVDWGTTPYAEGLRKSVERGQLLGAPSYRWIAAGQRLTNKYVIFLAEKLEGFRGTADVERRDGGILIREIGSQRTIRLQSKHGRDDPLLP